MIKMITLEFILTQTESDEEKETFLFLSAKQHNNNNKSLSLLLCLHSSCRPPKPKTQQKLSRAYDEALIYVDTQKFRFYLIC